MEIALIAFLAFVIDCIIGDPNSKYHPVALMGKLIDILDKLLRKDNATEPTKLVCGFILVAILLSFSYGITYGIITLLDIFNCPSWLNIFIQAVILSFMISPKALAKAGKDIYDELINHNLDQAREKVNYIVSRDANRMNEQDITRATVETVAENIVDGIISPLFYFFIGGLPLAVLYRMSNTMDAMIGYKNDKYLYFGRTAARIDDVLNFIPARITGLLLIVVAFYSKLNAKGALKMMMRDAKKHPSPNGGYTEATVAGALDIRLGGINYYFGRQSFRAYMGEAINELNAQHIQQTIKLMYNVSTLFLIIMCVGYIIITKYQELSL
ncbi:cobalamin biosynthesis protein CobD [Megamonas hypermegale ART12/1]|nr:cobalamin biosynthesis protein CobD [Megamonas hypermegale ART12/1]